MLIARARAAIFPASKSAINASNDCGNAGLLTTPHLALPPVSVSVMRITKHVHRSVHYQARQLLANADTSLARIGGPDRRARMPEVFAIQSRDSAVADKRDGYQRVGHAFASTNSAHNVTHALF